MDAIKDLLVVCYLLVFASVSVESGVTHPGETSSQCALSDPLEDEKFVNALNQFQQQLGPPGCNPPKNKSCQDIHLCFPSSPSGHYQIQLANGSMIQVYCDMKGTNCG